MFKQRGDGNGHIWRQEVKKKEKIIE